MTITLKPELKQKMVSWAEDIVDKVKTQRGQTSQLRNMLQIAGVESEVKVLANFIDYQAARHTTRRFWTPIHTDVTQVLELIEQELERAERNDARHRSHAFRNFFGFMVRRYVYLTETHTQENQRNKYRGGRRP